MSDDQALTIQSQIATDSILHDVAGQLAPRSRRIYQHDAATFATWMIEQGLTPQHLEKTHIIAYRAYLQAQYAKSTATRMLSVARRLLAEQLDRQLITQNPAQNVRGFKGEQETTHVALTPGQAQNLLNAIDTKTLLGLRDYVLILFLLRTGVRRSEAATLTIADLTMRQGHHVAVIKHGKGDKRRIVKVPVDVWRELEDYLEARSTYHRMRLSQLLGMLEHERELLTEIEYQAKRQSLIDQQTMNENDGLFVRVRRGNHPTREAMTDRSIATVVERYAHQIEVEALSPHGLRASFITLTLEAGASLHQVQYAAGHSDPRTTERYQKRKLNLDHNAVDTIHFVRRQQQAESAEMQQNGLHDFYSQ